MIYKILPSSKYIKLRSIKLAEKLSNKELDPSAPRRGEHPPTQPTALFVGNDISPGSS